MKFAKVTAALVALVLLVPAYAAEAVTKKAQKITWTSVSSLKLGASATIAAKASSKLAVKATSSTPAICKVTASTVTALAVGVCNFTLAQAGNKKFKPAPTIKASVKVTGAVRSTSDQPDTFNGFQIHAVYVQPADHADKQLDTNGYIADLLDEGNDLLKRELGLTLPIDKTAAGYDIEYMKSKYTDQQIRDKKPTQLAIMMNELLPFNSPSANRKNYVFFIDVANLNGSYCGWADLPGMAAVVALGGTDDEKNKCHGDGGGLKDYASKTWVHEVFHNLGVEHTPTPCDLMYVGATVCSTSFRIDKDRKLYVDATAFGKDITTLRVWAGETANTGLAANCFVNLDDYQRTDPTPFAYCPTGTQLIGDLGCFDKALEKAVLQRRNGDTWVDVAQGNIVSKSWGASVDKSCSGAYPVAPSASFTQTSPGVVQFRWIINDDFPQDSFDVIFAR